MWWKKQVFSLIQSGRSEDNRRGGGGGSGRQWEGRRKLQSFSLILFFSFLFLFLFLFELIKYNNKNWHIGMCVWVVWHQRMSTKHNSKQIEKRMIYYHRKKFSKCFAKLFLTKCLPFLSRIQNHSKKITQNESKIIKIETERRRNRLKRNLSLESRSNINFRFRVWFVKGLSLRWTNNPKTLFIILFQPLKIQSL